VPSVLAAWRAPFPLAAEQAVDAQGLVITEDDPSRLDAQQQALQRLAGQASVYAMLSILVILVIDAKILGSLQGTAPGEGGLAFGLLVLSGLGKLWLSLRCFALARRAHAAMPDTPGNAYRRNARGAQIATGVSAAASLLILGVAARMAF